MNRRHRAVIALVIAVGLFGAPLVSPVPNYDAHLQMENKPVNLSTIEKGDKQVGNMTTVRYQTLSTPAQRFFDRVNKGNGSNERLQRAFPPDVVNKHNGSDDIIVPLDEVPKPWSTFVPKSGDYDRATVYVHKDGQYYSMDIERSTPGPSFQALMLRLGSLLGAVGLGTLAGYFTLTTEEIGRAHV